MAVCGGERLGLRRQARGLGCLGLPLGFELYGGGAGGGGFLLGTTARLLDRPFLFCQARQCGGFRRLLGAQLCRQPVACRLLGGGSLGGDAAQLGFRCGTGNRSGFQLGGSAFLASCLGQGRLLLFDARLRVSGGQQFRLLLFGGTGRGLRGRGLGFPGGTGRHGLLRLLLCCHPCGSGASRCLFLPDAPAGLQGCLLLFCHPSQRSSLGGLLGKQLCGSLVGRTPFGICSLCGQERELVFLAGTRGGGAGQFGGGALLMLGRDQGRLFQFDAQPGFVSRCGFDPRLLKRASTGDQGSGLCLRRQACRLCRFGFLLRLGARDDGTGSLCLLLGTKARCLHCLFFLGSPGQCRGCGRLLRFQLRLRLICSTTFGRGTLGGSAGQFTFRRGKGRRRARRCGGVAFGAGGVFDCLLVGIDLRLSLGPRPALGKFPLGRFPGPLMLSFDPRPQGQVGLAFRPRLLLGKRCRLRLQPAGLRPALLLLGLEARRGSSFEFCLLCRALPRFLLCCGFDFRSLHRDRFCVPFSSLTLCRLFSRATFGVSPLGGDASQLRFFLGTSSRRPGQIRRHLLLFFGVGQCRILGLDACLKRCGGDALR